MPERDRSLRAPRKPHERSAVSYGQEASRDAESPSPAGGQWWTHGSIQQSHRAPETWARAAMWVFKVLDLEQKGKL